MFTTVIGKCPLCGHIIDKPIRSTQQNRWLWGVCYKMIAEHTGYSADEIHELMKHRFLRHFIDIETRNGIEQLETVKSTTQLNTIEFNSYTTQIQQWASIELGISIPDPNEVT